MTEHHEDYVAQHTAQELARRLLEVEKKVRRTASAQGDLRHSAIDYGASIPIKDAEGNVTAVLGGHDEPLHYVGGPDPVQPEPPFVDTGGENVKIQHSGFDIYNDRAPANFRRARIYVSRETGFEPGPESFAAYMEEADGSVTHRLPGGEWYVGIVWETLSGKLSPMSETVLADVAPLVDAQDIEDTLAEAEQIIADAVAEAQTQLDTLRDRLDNFEGFDPSDLIAQINQVTEDLADARQEAAGLVSDLADQVDGIKIPDVSGFVTQAEVDAAATAAETAAKEHADLVAQGAEDNAIAEAEAKANAAREAAETAAKAYTDQQDIETLEAAAADATAKADAAQTAAEAEADRLAKAEAQAAQTEAIRVAAADALAQANAARDAAIESASTDATDKADAAQAAAVAYAEAEAQAKADAAQAEAIRQAAEDATAKANKAREDAEAAANEYADRQDAQVKIDAALDAQEKADAVREVAEAAQAEAESKASPEWVLSRGTDLVTNGTGYLNDNTNFTDFEFDPSDGPTGARGSFVVESNRRPSGTFTDEMLPVDPTRSYMFSVMAREQNEGVASNFYTGLAPYDSAGFQINPQSYSHDPLTMTELAKPLNPGDTTIEVVSTENFERLSAASYVGIWDWVDPDGKTWDAGTYTRDYPRFDSIEGNVLHLRSAYTGEPRPVGTPVSNNRAGGTYMYAVSNKLATNTWERTHNIFGGIHDTTSGNAVTAFPPSTAAVRIMWLPNYGGAENSRQAFAAVSFSDATAALAEAEEARRRADQAQSDADSAQAKAEEAHTEAGKAWDHADAGLNRAISAESNAIEEAGRLATAAREAAEAEADRLAKAEAQAAQAEAIRQAKADALAQAEAARDAAIESSSGDATAKADAAQAAAEEYAEAEAQAKADAAQAEAIRQAALDATAKANAAKTAAENAAKQHADNLPKMLGGSTAPTGTAPNGSIWFRRDSSNTVIGRWERINGSWVQQEVSGQLIDNLEAGKITALNTEFAESVIGKLWTQLAIVDRLVATSAWIGGAMIGEDAVEAKHVVASESLSGKVAEFLKLSVADLIAGSAEIDEAVVEKFWAAFGVFDRLTAAGAWVTGDLVVGETIRTRHLHVTQEMVGEFAKFMHLVVDQMDVNALWADTAWLTAIETASIRLQSVVDSWTTNITGRGMEVISPQGEPTVQLGNFEENGLTLYQDGEATASMTDDGHMSGKYVSANEEFYYQGDELSDILALEHMPRGVVAQGETSSQVGPYFKHTGIAYLQFLAIPGRLYKATISGMARTNGGGTSTGTYISAHVRHTSGVGSGWPNVTVNSDQEAGSRRIAYHPESGSYRGFEYSFYWTYPNPELLAQKPTRILFAMQPLSSGAGAQLGTGVRLAVEDVGLLPEEGIIYSMGGSDGGTAPAPAPTPEPKPKTRRTKTYSMSWWRTWWQNGNVPSSGVGVKEAAQGRTPYFTSAGTYRSMIGFPSMTSDLSGADIEKIEVRVRVTHSHAGSGGRVRLGTHSNSSRPSSYTGYSNAESTNTLFGRGQERWVTLPSSLYNGFKNGTYRGVTMFTSSTSSTYYVQARPDRFAIRVTYRK